MENSPYIALQHKDEGTTMATVKSKATQKSASAKQSTNKTVSPKAVNPKSNKLITNIDEIKPTKSLKNGVSKMTKATEKKAEKAKAETLESATSFFGDVRERATTAAEKSREFLNEATTVTRANLEAVTESGKIAAKGTQELAKENLAYAKSNLTEAQGAVKTLVAVKSPTEFVKVQGDLARKGFDTMVTQGSKNTETMIKLAGDIFQPLSNRLAVASDFFKKAA